MIYRHEMAHYFNQDLSTRNYSLEVNACIMNRKPKLPPILPGATNLAVQSSRSSLQQNQNLSSPPETVSLPRIDLCSPCLQERKPGNSCQHNTRKSCKNTDYPKLPFPHVYSVLPPIGKTLEPSAPSSSRKTELDSSENSTQHSENNTPRRKRQSSRIYRIKKQTPEVSETVTETVTEPAVVDDDDDDDDDKSLKTTTQSSIERNEIFAIHVSDTMEEEEEEEERNLSTANKLDEAKNAEPREGDILSARNIPDMYRLYADVYPVSPPPHERRARYAVERKRVELKDDRLILVGFMEGASNQRRNATCAELDELLKNAVELLRDIFLKQTMEELCMIW